MSADMFVITSLARGTSSQVSRPVITKYTRLDVSEGVDLDYDSELVDAALNILTSLYSRTSLLAVVSEEESEEVVSFPKVSPDNIFELVCILAELECTDSVYEYLADNLLEVPDSELAKFVVEIVNNISTPGEPLDKVVARLISKDLRRLNRVVWLSFPRITVPDLAVFVRELRGKQILRAAKLNNYFDYAMNNIDSVYSIKTILNIISKYEPTLDFQSDIKYLLTTETVNQYGVPLLTRQLVLAGDDVWSTEFSIPVSKNGLQEKVTVVISMAKTFMTFKTVEIATFCPKTLQLGFLFLNETGDHITTDERKEIFLKSPQTVAKFTVTPETVFRTLVVLD